jgi:hypothetical protein
VRRILIATCALLSVVSTRAQANALAVADCNVSPVRAVQPWPEPLNRLISVRGGGLSLRDALDRVSAAARVRITYSDALIAPERRGCFDCSRTGAWRLAWHRANSLCLRRVCHRHALSRACVPRHLNVLLSPARPLAVHNAGLVCHSVSLTATHSKRSRAAT